MEPTSATVSRAGEDVPVVVVAGFFRRAAAGFVDGAIVLPISSLVAFLAGRLSGLALPPARQRGIDYWLDLMLAGDPALWGAITLGAVIAALYLLLFQALAGRTLGMRLLGLRVIDLYGDPPRFWRAATRTLGYFACVATLSLGFLWIGFDREKRGLHDWLAGTLVIRDGGAGT